MQGSSEKAIGQAFHFIADIDDDLGRSLPDDGYECARLLAIFDLQSTCGILNQECD